MSTDTTQDRKAQAKSRAHKNAYTVNYHSRTEILKIKVTREQNSPRENSTEKTENLSRRKDPSNHREFFLEMKSQNCHWYLDEIFPNSTVIRNRIYFPINEKLNPSAWISIKYKILLPTVQASSEKETRHQVEIDKQHEHLIPKL